MSSMKNFSAGSSAEGLEDYLTVELMDYRDLANSGKTFDRVVSVGMVEHVGRDNYQLIYGLCQQSLKDGGVFLASFYQRPEGASRRCMDQKVYFPRRCDPQLTRDV